MIPTLPAGLTIDNRGIEEVGAAGLLVAVTMVRHWPAPWNDAGPVYCSIFDSAQDLCKNNDRIGERRTRPSVGPNAPEPAPPAEVIPNAPKGQS